MKIPWRRKWPPTPAFLLGKSRGQRSLAGYKAWGRKESDTTEHTAHEYHRKRNVLLDLNEEETHLEWL